jgi:crossover junction endodeoxyribonuclease RusA
MIEITVYGQPAPQGSKRHVGKGVMIESSKKVKPWRQDVKFAALAARAGAAPIDGPVRAIICFTMPKPKSAPKLKRTWPHRKPDIDKLLRSTFDALSDAGIWTDDARVVECWSEKAYVGDRGAMDSPGAHIKIEAIG